MSYKKYPLSSSKWAKQKISLYKNSTKTLKLMLEVSRNGKLRFGFPKAELTHQISSRIFSLQKRTIVPIVKLDEPIPS